MSEAFWDRATAGASGAFVGIAVFIVFLIVVNRMISTDNQKPAMTNFEANARIVAAQERIATALESLATEGND